MFEGWFTVISDEPGIAQGARAAWAISQQRLELPRSRWRRVLGHIDAVVATLFDIEWQPVSPTEWIDMIGHRWIVGPKASDHGWPNLRAALQRDIELLLWRKAARHQEANGLEQGVDWSVSVRHLRRLRQAARFDREGALFTFLQGADWTMARRFEAGYCDSPICTRCDAGVPETRTHRLWECAANATIQDEAIGRSADLVQRAIENAEACPGFWLRGLTPKTWTWLPPPDGNMPIKTWGVLGGGAPFQLDHRHIIGTDGSGGLFSSDPRLRRCGCGCIVLDRELMAPIGGAAFPLAGAIQTVPRSELSALIFVASRTRGAARLL